MSRYEKTQIIKNKNNIQRFKLMDEYIYKEVDSYHIHNIDRINYSLIALSKEYYNDPKLWWIIAKYNNIKTLFTDKEHINIPKNTDEIS